MGEYELGCIDCGPMVSKMVETVVVEIATSLWAVFYCRLELNGTVLGERPGPNLILCQTYRSHCQKTHSRNRHRLPRGYIYLLYFVSHEWQLQGSPTTAVA